MTNRQLEDKVRRAFTAAADTAAPSAPSSDRMKGAVIMINDYKPKRRFSVIAAAAVLILALLGAGALSIQHSQLAIANSISLDVNPSVKIDVNKNEKVVAVTGLNEEGLQVIGSMDFKGSGVDVTVNALIGSMLRLGYINEAANSILISVDGDPDSGARLQSKLMDEISQLLSTPQFTGSVMGVQLATGDEEIGSLAAQYGVSEAKAALIQSIVTADSRYGFGDLAGLSINELNLLISDHSMQDTLTHVQTTGQASDSAFIGHEAAKAIALDQAGVSETEVWDMEIELDSERGQMVYEIEFDSAAGEFSYDIDAYTGAIYKRTHKPADGQQPTDPGADSAGYTGTTDSAPITAGQPKEYIGEDAAIAIAIDHAGVSSGDARGKEAELDTYMDKLVYEVDFESGGYEYDYKIDAVTGEVIKWEKDRD